MRIFHWTAAIGMAVFCQTAALAESRMETSSKGLTADEEVQPSMIRTNAGETALYYSLQPEGAQEEDLSWEEINHRGFDEFVQEESGAFKLKMNK